MSDIKKDETPESLRRFIEGKRTADVRWCDWSIPIHWGGVSDPFQPVEREVRNSYECLKVFADTKYPFVVSTKGKLIAEPEYIELLRQCNAVVQISAVCPEYDRIEQGAPSFEERLRIMKAVAPNCLRLIVRIQPFMHEVLDSVLKQIPRFAQAGAYGVIFEGMKFFGKKPGLVRIGADYCYPYDVILHDYLRVEQVAHDNGLKCYAGENRLRGNGYGDSLSCCGIDGLEGFRPNIYNLNHILAGEDVEPTPAMKALGSGSPFRCLYQNNLEGKMATKETFDFMLHYYIQHSRKTVDDAMGISKR